MNTSKQQALLALITSPTIREASKKSGVAERTINEYMRTDAEFRQAYEQHRQDIIKNACEEMTASMLSASETLRDIMQDETASKSARITSAKAIFEYGIRLWEVADVNERLRAIEEKLQI